MILNKKNWKLTLIYTIQLNFKQLFVCSSSYVRWVKYDIDYVIKLEKVLTKNIRRLRKNSFDSTSTQVNKS